jgi:hypothetical protein
MPSHPATLTYPVIAEAVAGGWIAFVPGWAQAKAIGLTREAAIAQLHQWLNQQVLNNPPQSDFIHLDIPISSPEHPSTPFAIALTQNPLFDAMLAEVEKSRQEERDAYFQALDASTP